MNRELQKKAERSLFQTKIAFKTNGVYTTQDMVYLKELMKVGEIRAVIDRTYPLQELAAVYDYGESARSSIFPVIFLQ